MKKSHLKKIALLGISASTLATGSVFAAQHHGNTNSVVAAGVVFTDKLMTESDLQNALNDETKKIYNSLPPEGKALALKYANQSDEAFSDKNEAVKAAAKKVEQKQKESSK